MRALLPKEPLRTERVLWRQNRRPLFLPRQLVWLRAGLSPPNNAKSISPASKESDTPEGDTQAQRHRRTQVSLCGLVYERLSVIKFGNNTHTRRRSAFSLNGEGPFGFQPTASSSAVLIFGTCCRQCYITWISSVAPLLANIHVAGYNNNLECPLPVENKSS